MLPPWSTLLHNKSVYGRSLPWWRMELKMQKSIMLWISGQQSDTSLKIAVITQMTLFMMKRQATNKSIKTSKRDERFLYCVRSLLVIWKASYCFERLRSGQDLGYLWSVKKLASHTEVEVMEISIRAIYRRDANDAFTYLVVRRRSIKCPFGSQLERHVFCSRWHFCLNFDTWFRRIRGSWSSLFRSFSDAASEG
jgi:hypothetical protein